MRADGSPTRKSNIPFNKSRENSRGGATQDRSRETHKTNLMKARYRTDSESKEEDSDLEMTIRRANIMEDPESGKENQEVPKH